MRNLFANVICVCLALTLSCAPTEQESKEVGEESAKEEETKAEKVEIETGVAEVNGTKLYYEVAGSGDPIVFVHGALGDNRHWDVQFEDFAKSYKVVRYDVRGYGKSSPPVVGESYSHHDDLKALLDHLGISKAHVCGLSQGSAIAVDFILTYPEMGKSLISVGPWLFAYNSPTVAKALMSMGKIPSVVSESGPKAATDFWAELPLFKDSVKNLQVMERFKEIGYDYQYWHFLNPDPVVYADPPAVQQIDRISLPTLIVTAEYDLEPCKEIADILAKRIPNALKVVIADAGHAMHAEKPEEFKQDVIDFLKKIK